MTRFVLVACVALSGCALTSKAPPVEIRYFSPEKVEPARLVPAAPETDEVRARVKLGRVGSSAHLRNRIAYRTSEYELGTYDTLRWTENPEVYLRRSLERALFEQRSIVQVATGAAPLLDVELVVFEEVRRKSGRAGRVVVRYSLVRDKEVVARGDIAIEHEALADEGMASVAEALGRALEQTTSQIADVVVERLAP